MVLKENSEGSEYRVFLHIYTTRNCYPNSPFMTLKRVLFNDKNITDVHTFVENVGMAADGLDRSLRM